MAHRLSKQLDTVGWFIVTLHQLLGHRGAAAVLGEPQGDVRQCILCRYEAHKATREDVIDRLGVEAT
jgi:hypothetical protein